LQTWKALCSRAGVIVMKKPQTQHAAVSIEQLGRYTPSMMSLSPHGRVSNITWRPKGFRTRTWERRRPPTPTWTKKNVHKTSRCLVPDRSAGLIDLSRCRDRARILPTGYLHDIHPGLAKHDCRCSAQPQACILDNWRWCGTLRGDRCVAVSIHTRYLSIYKDG